MVSVFNTNEHIADELQQILCERSCFLQSTLLASE